MLTAEKVRAALEELSPTQEKVDLAVKTAVEIAQPSRVILFGSWPRGDARWDSDLDMAVLMPDSFLDRLGQIHRRIRSKLSALPATPIPLDQLNDFAVVYRHDLLFQFASPNLAELKETVRLIREHIVARISALSTTPEPPPLQ